MNALAGLFLHPGIAVSALAAVALPIAIHFLFRRRRVPIDWGAMELLREAVRRTNRRLRLEQWLVLALRSLLVLLAGLAVAAPFAGGLAAGGRGERTWVVVIDDGVASALRVGDEAELARVRDEALAVVEARGAGDRVAIVRASVPVQTLLAPTADASAVRETLARLAPRETPSDLAGALETAREVLAAEGRAGTIVVASGFRRGALAALGESTADAVDERDDGTAEGAARGVDGGVEIVAVAPAREAPVDVRIVEADARVLPGADRVAVRVRVGREGASLEPSRSSVRARGDGLRPSGVRTVEWGAGQAEASVELQLVPESIGATGGGRSRRGVVIEVSPGDGAAGDPLAPGDRAYAVLDAQREIEVAVVGRRGSLDAADLDRVPASLWAARALAPTAGSGMRVREIDPSGCDARALVGVDAVVVARPDLLSPASCADLGAFVAAGGVVLVLPAGESRAQGWGGVLLPALGVPMRVASEAVDRSPPSGLSAEQPESRLLASIRPEIAGLAAPVEVSRMVPIEGIVDADVVLRLADGTPWMTVQRAGAGDDAEGGVVALVASAPELAWTNLPVKPLVVPLLQETVRAALEWSASFARASVGSEIVAPGASALRLDAGDADDRTAATAIPVGADGRSALVVPRAGIWRGDDGSVFAANLRLASLATAPSDPESVRAALGRHGSVRLASGAETGGDASSRAAATDAWAFPLFVAALVALLLEGVLSRAFSHASLARAGRAEDGVAATARRTAPATGGAR